MNTPASPRHPVKALVAIAAMFALVHGVWAHADTHERRSDNPGARDGSWMQRACPDSDEDALADPPSTASDDDAEPSDATVTFEVRDHAVYEVAPQVDAPRALAPLPRGAHGLRCDGEDDEAQAVRFVVRWIDRDSRWATR